MNARDERVAEVRRALRAEIGPPTDRDYKWRPMVSAGEVRVLLDALDAALADAPAQATLARAWDEGYGAGVSAPANRALGLGNPTNPYRAALVPGHDHEGGK